MVEAVGKRPLPEAVTYLVRGALGGHKAPSFTKSTRARDWRCVPMKENYMTKPLGTIARTGEACPESGVWKPANGSTTAPIAKGNRMPPYNGAATSWTLIQYA